MQRNPLTTKLSNGVQEELSRIDQIKSKSTQNSDYVTQS